MDVSGLQVALALEQAVVAAVEKVEPSVVAIAGVPIEEDPPFGPQALGTSRPDPFDRKIDERGAREITDPEFLPEHFGTGVVVDRSGLILTAAHVLREGCRYFVVTSNQQSFRASVKASDPRCDLAILDVEASDLRPIRFGDGGKVRKGQFVLAMGNPHGVARDGEASVSWGIVSNLARKAPAEPGSAQQWERPTLHHFGTLIQTDAKLNLGVSGGPLLNLRGEMIGLTTSLAAVAGYETSAGYAYPVDENFRRVVETLKQGREAEFGFLGVRPPSDDAADSRPGVEVDYVIPNGPADRGGLRPGDVILEVDGRAVADFDELVLRVGSQPVETRVRLTVLRDDRVRPYDVVLGKYPVEGRRIVTERPAPWRGMAIDYPSALTDDDGRWLAGARSVDVLGNGVIVTDVAEGSSAWRAGLRPGMCVSHVGRTPVRTPDDFRRAVDGIRGDVSLRLDQDFADDPVDAIRTVRPET